MRPFELGTERLILDQPGSRDVDDIVRCCQDPLFERYLTVPWPYRRADAVYFVSDFVPHGWETDREYTWAIRRRDDPRLLGVIGYRTGRSDLGYWLDPSARGFGYMTEAVLAVAGWAFESGADAVLWECVAGNAASAAVARRAGFGFTGEAPSSMPFRDGTHPPSWHGTLRPKGAVETGPETLEWPEP